jgi:ATP adenylyltransferase
MIWNSETDITQFQFHVADSLTRKPRTAGSKKRAPAFTGDSEDFTLGVFGTRHKLILNKYCAVRPQMVLHTIDFEPQDDLLNAHDFKAAWLALETLGDEYMVIFNGGKDAGASLNHKHMQVIPRSGHSGLESLLQDPEDGAQGAYPGHIRCEEVRIDLCIAMPDLGMVPFRLSVGFLPRKPDAESLQQLFAALRKELELKSDQPYNMVLYHHSMVVIPRRTANIDGIDANAAGMTGVVWCSSEAQYKEWQRIGPMQLLQQFGVPSDR